MATSSAGVLLLLLLVALVGESEAVMWQWFQSTYGA
jgi:hypothetical protein